MSTTKDKKREKKRKRLLRRKAKEGAAPPQPAQQGPPPKSVTFLENGQIVVPDGVFRGLDELFSFLQLKVYRDWDNPIFLNIQQDIIQRNQAAQETPPPAGEAPLDSAPAQAEQFVPPPTAPAPAPQLQAVPDPAPTDEDEFEEVTEDEVRAELAAKRAEMEELEALLAEGEESEDDPAIEA
jgi:hypothetical protein